MRYAKSGGVMGTEFKTRVVVAAMIENLLDHFAVKRGIRTPDRVRLVQVRDAIVDLTTTFLSLPKGLISHLGIESILYPRTDPRHCGIVRLTIQGRTCYVDVVQGVEGSPVLIGSIPCQSMDWAVDPKTNTLVDDPGPRRPFLHEPYPTDPNPAS
jgi:hypothetical protein